MTDRIEVNVVAYQDGDLWVAQCVEYDILATAKALIDLPRAFERAAAANLCVNVDLGNKAFDGLPPAPARFRKMFDQSDFDLKLRAHGQPAAPKGPVKIRDIRVAEAA